MKPLALACLLALAAPLAAQDEAKKTAPATPRVVTEKPFDVEALYTFEEPWAMAFLPDGRLLVTQKKGKLMLLKIGEGAVEVSGAPKVAYGGQGGFGDVYLHPEFAENGWVYLSYVESDDKGLKGAVVSRAKLTLTDATGALSELTPIWKQEPKLDGQGHFGHRIRFSKDGHLFISSGERQHFDPAQDRKANLGKVVRLNDDGSVPKDNPFAAEGGVTAQIWSMGHRNPLGFAFDAKEQLWVVEMGPKGGDELNLIERGANYGYPIVSNGDHYEGKDIPDHWTRPEFTAPKIWWTPVISPGSLIFYDGDEFADWKGDGLIAALSGQAIVRVEFDGTDAKEAARYPMGQRIRELEQGPDGAIYALEDGKDGNGGRLLKLTAKK